MEDDSKVANSGCEVNFPRKLNIQNTTLSTNGDETNGLVKSKALTLKFQYGMKGVTYVLILTSLFYMLLVFITHFKTFKVKGYI